jgi:hypothetical protein
MKRFIVLAILTLCAAALVVLDVTTPPGKPPVTRPLK